MEGGCRVIMKLFQATLLCNGSLVGLRWILKATWSRELTDNYTVIICVYCNYVCMSTITMKEETVCVKCNIKPGHEAVISKTLSFIALNFQRPG